MTRKIKRIGTSTLKEVLEENKLKICDRELIKELLTYVNKGMSFEADRGYHDDLVMNCVVFSWFLTTEYFEHLTNNKVKDLLYSGQQQEIYDDVLPVGVFGQQNEESHSFVDTSGDRWFLQDND
jgi:hypothetical protein